MTEGGQEKNFQVNVLHRCNKSGQLSTSTENTKIIHRQAAHKTKRYLQKRTWKSLLQVTDSDMSLMQYGQLSCEEQLVAEP